MLSVSEYVVTNVTAKLSTRGFWVSSETLQSACFRLNYC